MVEISDSQYCDACHAMVDIGVQLLRKRVMDLDGAHQTGRHEINWQSKEMDEQICDKGMKLFKPHLIIGCKRIVDGYAQSMWGPWYGHHDNSELLSDSAVLKHKLSFCKSIDACIAGGEDSEVTVENTPRRRTGCAACAELAADARTILRRLILKEFDDRSISPFLERWCGSISLRHFRPAAIVDACSEIMESHEREFRQLLADPTRVFPLLKSEEAWEHAICVNMTKHCTKKEWEKLRTTWDNAYEAEYENAVVRYRLLDVQSRLNDLKDRDSPEAKVLFEEEKALTRELAPKQAAYEALKSKKRRWALPNGEHISKRMREVLKAKAEEAAKKKKEEERKVKLANEETAREEQKRLEAAAAVEEKQTFPAGSKWATPAMPAPGEVNNGATSEQQQQQQQQQQPQAGKDEL